MSETGQSPSAGIIADAVAKRTATIKDDLGRTLTVRRMSVSERLKFMKLVPPTAQQNQLWITNAMIIASVVEIDGVPSPPLKNEVSIEQFGDQLGDEGLAAAQVLLATLLPKSLSAAEDGAKLGE